jgi:hypothetical protein
VVSTSAVSSFARSRPRGVYLQVQFALISDGFDGGRRGEISGRRLVIGTSNRALAAEDNQIDARWQSNCLQSETTEGKQFANTNEASLTISLLLLALVQHALKTKVSSITLWFNTPWFNELRSNCSS